MTDEDGVKAKLIQPLLPGILMAQMYIRSALYSQSPELRLKIIILFSRCRPARAAVLCRLQTMVALMNVQSSASMPMLLQLLSAAQEFSGICLRRSEKRVLNAINKNAKCVRYNVEDPSKPGKPTTRIKTAAEKIFVLVCQPSCLAECPCMKMVDYETAHLSHSVS